MTSGQVASKIFSPRRSASTAHRLRNAVGAEDDRCAAGHFVEFFDEYCALGLEPIDDETVMHDFMTDVDGRTEFFERTFNDGDGAFDAGAETTGVGEEDVHQSIPITSTSKRIDLPASG